MPMIIRNNIRYTGGSGSGGNNVSLDASNVVFDDTNTQFGADNVQNVIEKLNTNLDEQNKKIQNFSQTLSLNDCSTLDEIFETIFNNLDKVCYISCGDNNENSAKTALSINTGWAYATAYAEIVSQRCIRFSVFAMGAKNTCYRPKIRYLYNNTTNVVWTSLE